MSTDKTEPDYESPAVELLRVEIEKGFATSTGGSWDNADWQEGEKDWFN